MVMVVIVERDGRGGRLCRHSDAGAAAVAAAGCNCCGGDHAADAAAAADDDDNDDNDDDDVFHIINTVFVRCRLYHYTEVLQVVDPTLMDDNNETVLYLRRCSDGMPGVIITTFSQNYLI